MSAADPILEVRGVRFGFADKPDFLGPIDLVICPGEFWGVLGPNGAGKTTLLRLLAGILRPRAGGVCLEGREIGSLSPRERGRRLAYLPQKLIGDPDASALEVVLMGRFPHRSFGLFESAEDHTIALEAMKMTETEPFARRPLSTLSGGEAQRVHVAAALAQQSKVFLLDEPTSALDLAHQLAVFDALRRLTHRDRLATVAVTHDINLAGHHCDHLALMHEGRIAAKGPAAEVLNKETLESVYEVKFAVHESAENGRRWMLPLGVERVPH